MTQGISEDLIDRIHKRILDDWRRTGDGDWQRTPLDHRRKSEASSSPLAELLQQLVQSNGLAPLKAIEPLNEKAIAKVEGTLGFSIPSDLRRLYRDVGDGGFGPFNGIRCLSNWAKDYAKLKAEMPTKRGREWPEALLPIVYLNGKRICVDRQTGSVVLWTKPPKKGSEKKWLASFVQQSATLGEWLELWVDTPTWCEGGPEGGWIPTSDEAARRASVEQQKQERQSTEVERAHRFKFGDHPALSAELLERVRERAFDPARRTNLSGAMARSRAVDIGDMARDIQENPHLGDEMRNRLGDMACGVEKLSALLGAKAMRMFDVGSGLAMADDGAGGVLGEPATEHQMKETERSLGFPLPAALTQLYAIADGGFGPGDEGFWPLARISSQYSSMITQPQGPNDEPWPAKLLPFYKMDPALGCFDLESGAIVVHDVQLMDHIGKGQWSRTFVAEYPDIVALIDAWLISASFA